MLLIDLTFSVIHVFERYPHETENVEWFSFVNTHVGIERNSRPGIFSLTLPFKVFIKSRRLVIMIQEI